MATVLIIDDDTILRMAIKEVLTDQGFHVLEADNGAVGFSMAKQHLPDLILCDFLMDTMNGHEALTVLRSEPSTSTIPVILMTGSPELANMRSTMNLGADDYLTKPFDMGTLLSAVDARCKKQEALKQMTERKLSGLRQNIILMLPHELNTPLTGILGFAELIASSAETLTPKEVSGMAQDIFTAGQRLQRLIRNFLVYSQMELIRNDPIEIQQLRSQACPEASLHIERTALIVADRMRRSDDLILEISPASAAISTDLLNKVAEELIDNAFKFSEPGTKVRVCCGQDSGQLYLTIEDHGRGIQAGHLQDVGAFSQFQRKMYEQQGTGLGLAIAHRLAELHDGKFELKSHPAKGTTVSIHLPCLPPSPCQ